MNRLEKIVDLVSPGKLVCDIGTDHGITAIKILEEKNPKKVIATDISANSLRKLEEKVEEFGYDIETLVTDGIKDLGTYKPEEIIISGLGGYLISKILQDGKDVAKGTDKLILQANNSLAHLRKYLLENEFAIIDEAIVYDEGIYYDIIVASYKPGHISSYEKDYYYEYGKLLIDGKEPLLKAKLEDKLEKIYTIEENLNGLDGSSVQARLKELADEKSIIGEVLSCL